jgi:hypothetical protein
MINAPRRGNAGRLSPRTLSVASAASATAALITSRLWFQGTALAAALTPVIVSVVSELLDRPARHVSRLRATRRGASPADDELRASEGSQIQDGAPEYTLYAARRRSPRLKVALLTSAIAFLIAVAALTLPELISGKAVATDRHTTIFGGTPPRQDSSQPASRPTTPPTATAPKTTRVPPAVNARPQTRTTTPPTSPPASRRLPPTPTPEAGQTTPTR